MAATTGLPEIQIWSTFSGTIYVPITPPVLEVSLRSGQRKLTDGISAGTAYVRGRRPDLMNETPFIGMKVQVRVYMKLAAGGTTNVNLGFRVADYRINYGRSTAEDTWEMELEDAFAYLGRASLPTTVIANGTATNTAAATIASAAGLTQTSYGTTTTTTSGQTVTDQNGLDVYQTLVNTEGAKVLADATSIRWYARNYWIYNSTVSTFSDTGAANTFNYTTFEARSLADNYAEKVIVRPRGSSDVVSGTGIFSYNLDSYSFDTGEAQNLADFMRGSLDVDVTTPTVIGFQLNGKDSTILDVFKREPRSASVIFRGVTTLNQVLGFEIYSNPEETRAVLYLANSDFLNFLILNDAVYGKLDSNRLGW